MEGYGNENPGAFQSTRPLRGATPSPASSSAWWWYFNPRAPCGARRGGKTASCGELIFQPTRPLRGATRRVVRGCKNQMHFNPRAPCGARLEARPAAGAAIANFNPRAPCGARRCDFGDKWGRHIFQPTRPLRGATTEQMVQMLYYFKISTHAPLAGRDRLCMIFLA